MSALSNKVAIVTGASSGIGYATAKLFAGEGAKVVVAARRQAELDALVEEITHAGGHAVALAGDVKDEAFAQALVELAKARFGGLDVAFNNAGTIGEMGATTEVSLSGWEDTIRTNLTSAFLGAKYQLPAMLDRNGGSLIFKLLEPRAVRRLLDDHRSGRQDNHKLLFSLVMFEHWLRETRSQHPEPTHASSH